jgi:hypothetical protein
MAQMQRAIFQPVAVAIFAMSAAWLSIKGSVSADTIRLFCSDCRYCSLVRGWE